MLYTKYYKPYNWLQNNYFFNKYKKTKYGKTYRLLMILYIIVTNIKKINNLYRALKSKKSNKHLKLNWKINNNIVDKKKNVLKKKIFLLKKFKLEKKIKKFLNKKLFNYKYFLLLYLTEMHRYVRYSKIEALINIINHSLYYKKKKKKLKLKKKKI